VVVANATMSDRPKHGDHFIHVRGRKKCTPSDPGDLADGSNSPFARAKASQSGTAGKVSRLNLVLLVRHDPEARDADTWARSVTRTAACSTICPSAQYSIGEWSQARGVLDYLYYSLEFSPAKDA